MEYTADGVYMTWTLLLRTIRIKIHFLYLGFTQEAGEWSFEKGTMLAAYTPAVLKFRKAHNDPHC